MLPLAFSNRKGSITMSKMKQHGFPRYCLKVNWPACIWKERDKCTDTTFVDGDSDLLPYVVSRG